MLRYQVVQISEGLKDKYLLCKYVHLILDKRQVEFSQNKNLDRDPYNHNFVNLRSQTLWKLNPEFDIVK